MHLRHKSSFSIEYFNLNNTYTLICNEFILSSKSLFYLFVGLNEIISDRLQAMKISSNDLMRASNKFYAQQFNHTLQNGDYFYKEHCMN